MKSTVIPGGRILVAALALSAFVSCRQAPVGSYSPVRFVQEILEDEDHPANDILSASSVPSRYGDIELVGRSDACHFYSDILAGYDCHDNVDGSHRPDNLPDFSGERLVSLAGVRENIGPDDLKEFASRQLLNALDTSYSISPYDIERLGHKSRAKVVVMADPEFFLDGRREIDTLLFLHASDVKVFYPLAEAASRVLDGRSGVSVGFVCDSLAADTSIYGKVLDEVASARNVKVGTVFVSSIPSGSEDPLLAFLDAYIASGNTAPLNAVIVDAPGADVAAFKDRAGSVTSVLSPESLTYGVHVSEGFTVVGVGEVLADSCYHFLRNSNLFTHNVALPASSTFRSMSHPDADNPSILLVPTDAYVQE